jgi:hypothetical protein
MNISKQIETRIKVFLHHIPLGKRSFSPTGKRGCGTPLLIYLYGSMRDERSLSEVTEIFHRVGKEKMSTINKLPALSTVDRFHECFKIFFDNDIVFTEVTTPESAKTYLAVVELNPADVTFDIEEGGRTHEVTEDTSVMAVFTEETEFMIFGPTVTSVSKEDVVSYKLYETNKLEIN